MHSLQERYKEMEIRLQEKVSVEEENRILRTRMQDDLESNEREETDTKSQVTKGTACSDPDKSEKASMSHKDLVEENVRLTQLLLEFGEMEELEKLRTDNNIKKVDVEDDKDAAYERLQKELAEIKAELAEVTELKNAEISVLRKQLNRAEHLRTGREQTLQEVEDERGKSWDKEREGLREEIRRLNMEISSLKNNNRNRSSMREDEEEDLNLTSRYRRGSNGSGVPAKSGAELDNADVASLECIIAMMRQTIDQCNKEKDHLEQRLTEEQERSQMELQAFAKTLEGVDDLRKSAETMSREIRRIKVKGYRPTRTELFGTGMTSLEGGGRSYGELSAAVEASESMEEAIRLIESQNDAMEERRRMGVVASRAQASATTGDAQNNTNNESGGGRYRGIGGLAPIDDDREGGFLSFWNNTNGSEDNDTKNKEEKRKKSKRKAKKKSSGNGSVLTSFF
mmetsp:Transcript_9500/g.23208  ORF Transcript_9500/g.23208 Transcript_9500/m.23208 type:complete len:455 (-) Transcript_9500:150-1514(-)